MFFSLIIPVFNRPDEIRELLTSLSLSDFTETFEIVIIEDGSNLPCENEVREFSGKLDISYYAKPNSGPGDSRNYGMRKAKGEYFLIFDSDCIIPPHYLSAVAAELTQNYVDCFGGPDKALDSFSDIQRAINFAMTSFLTTGGIRGGSEKIDKFQPRSFNMGISKSAFEATKGFGNIHPGEDPDLSIRLWKQGFTTRLFPNAYVFHKRRISWGKFLIQVGKFGKARPILNKWHPDYAKITYLFPTAFLLGFIVALLFWISGNPILINFFLLYFLVIFITAAILSRSLKIGLLSVAAVAIQFYGYGLGFLKSFIAIYILNKTPEAAFPELFFKK